MPNYKVIRFLIFFSPLFLFGHYTQHVSKIGILTQPKSSFESRWVYIHDYKNYAQKREVDTAIAVIGYNRPEYFKQTVQALRSNIESTIFPVFFFLDGGPQSKQKEHIQIIDELGFNNAHIICREKNFNIAGNTIDLRQFLFDWCQFEKVMIIEDDNLISSTYISLILHLYEWANQKYSNIGIVSGWSERNKNRKFEDKQRCNRHVRASYDNLWAYLIDKRAWNAIKKGLWFYYNHLMPKDYKNKNVDSIKDWFMYLVKNPRGVKRNYYPYTVFPEIKDKIVKKTWRMLGQDGATLLLLYHAGFVYLTTDVNRVVNIGKVGYHTDPAKWEQYYQGIELYEDSNDANINEFIY